MSFYYHTLNKKMIVMYDYSTRELDGALLRPGRLSHLVFVPLPDEETRTQILKMTMQDTATAKVCF